MYDKINQEAPNKSRLYKKWVFLLALPLLVLIAGLKFCFNNEEPKFLTGERAMAYFDSKISVFAPYKTQSAQDSLGIFATLINEGKYEDALNMNLILKEDNPSFGTFQFFLGICHLRKKNRDITGAEKYFLKAQEIFALPTNPQPEWSSQNSLFLAIINAGKEDWEACLREAEKVDKTMAYYREFEVDKLINTARTHLNRPSE